MVTPLKAIAKSKKADKKRKRKAMAKKMFHTIFYITLFFSSIYMVKESYNALKRVFITENSFFSLKKYKIEVETFGDLTNDLKFSEQVDKYFSKLDQEAKGDLNIFEVDLKLCRQFLMEANIQFENISVTRVLPEGIYICAEDRQPVAQIHNKKGHLVDENGFILPKQRVDFRLPLIPILRDKKGIEVGEISNNLDITKCLAIIATINSSPYSHLFKINMMFCNQPDSITLIMSKAGGIKNGCRIILPRDDFNSAIDRAGKILVSRAKDGKTTSQIDATYKVNVPVIK